jgi:hypothetical protein
MTFLSEEFEEPVRAFNTEGRVVILFFTEHAGGYRLDADRDDFEAQLAAAASSFKRGRAAKVVARGLAIESLVTP